VVDTAFLEQVGTSDDVVVAGIRRHHHLASVEEDMDLGGSVEEGMDLEGLVEEGMDLE